MALKVERVVDSGIDAEETLCRAGRLEPLHLALSSAHGLMRVFGAVVLSNALLMRAGQAQVPESRSVGSELVGCELFRRKSPFAEQLAHEPECHALVAAALNQHVENLALVIDGAP